MSIYLGYLILIRLFVVWNTLITLGEQTPHNKESDWDQGSNTFNMCYMAQGDDRLEVNSDSELDEDMSYDELALFCKMLLKKYNLLNVEKNSSKKENVSLLNENDFLKKETASLSSKLDVIFEGNNSLKNKIDSLSKEKDFV